MSRQTHSQSPSKGCFRETPLQFYWWTCWSRAWNIPLVTLGWLSQLCSLLAFSLGPAWDTEKTLTLCQQEINTGVLSALSWSQILNVAAMKKITPAKPMLSPEQDLLILLFYHNCGRVPNCGTQSLQPQAFLFYFACRFLNSFKFYGHFLLFHCIFPYDFWWTICVSSPWIFLHNSSISADLM